MSVTIPKAVPETRPGGTPGTRIGVLDVGSNTVHLLVADTGVGLPMPVHVVKTRLQLAEQTDRAGRLQPRAIRRLAEAVEETLAASRRWELDELFGYATAAVRDAPNCAQALAAVQERAGVRLGLLTGIQEAELTFLAVRRWMGWRSGPLLMLDIGGGSVEIAYGQDVAPTFAVSLPIGAGRLTRDLTLGDPPRPTQFKALRRHVRGELSEIATRMRWEGERTAVATSRTFQQLARLCGAAPMREGPFVPRVLRRRDLKRQLDRLAGLSAAERAELPGISRPRARQSLAGAVIAHTAMSLLRIDAVAVCPWALREGILLRRLESRSRWHNPAGPLPWPAPRRPSSPTDPAVAAVLPMSPRSQRARVE
ncbi:Ppx/GppA family phosphatase [Krasilnikovia cinnamomea]|uniref:Ppx/GppA phosphatase family protein n=1 Tax=Krasilnikovia cinnamomea TaxID=349313 RepID=UPI001F5FC1A0|nr:Ppx/GppA family phosphatase [Krasilnikovia cinnamomea]